VKPQIVPLQAVKAGGGGDIKYQSFITSTLNKVQSSASLPACIFHGEGHSRPISRDLGEASETVWTFWPGEKSLNPGGNTPFLSCPAHSVVTITPNIT
jgi:hypothetical protein